MEANYEILHDQSTNDVLVIRDVGPWDRHKTVTNAAEQVVSNLYDQGLLDDGRRLLYYDSEGDRDELLHQDGKFLGFKPARE